MKILGISGSQNEKGNTAFAVRYALDVAKSLDAEVKYISIARLNVNYCLGCWNCSKTGQCVFDDDMNVVIDAMRWCDGMIVGSPVYFGTVSSQLKKVMERCVVLRPSYKLPYAMSGKTGVGIACAGFRNGGQELTLQNIGTFFQMLNMAVAGDGPGYSHMGAAINGKAAADKPGLETVKNSAENIVNILKTRVK